MVEREARAFLLLLLVFSALAVHSRHFEVSGAIESPFSVSRARASPLAPTMQAGIDSSEYYFPTLSGAVRAGPPGCVTPPPLSRQNHAAASRAIVLRLRCLSRVLGHPGAVLGHPGPLMGRVPPLPPASPGIL